MKEMLLKELFPSPDDLTIPLHPNNIEFRSTVKEFWNLFESGLIEQRITCMKCMNVTIKQDSFISLPLQFPYQNFHDNANDTKKTISLIDLFHHYQCDDDDFIPNYECAFCLDRQQATKTYRICKYPPILCIRIGRMRNDRSIIENPVLYPLTGLELNDDLRDSNTTPVGKCVYNLIAAVNHQPKSDGKGHYTAVTKHQTTNSWFEYDDDDVHRINFVGRNNNFSAVRYQRMASILFFEIDKSV